MFAAWKSFLRPVSPRGFPLLGAWRGLPRAPTLTVEDHEAWESVFVVGKDGSIRTVANGSLDRVAASLGLEAWSDRVPNPVVLAAYAAEAKAAIADRAWECVVGRWAEEVREEEWADVDAERV